jgi:hypothetical protein
MSGAKAGRQTAMISGAANAGPPKKSPRYPAGLNLHLVRPAFVPQSRDFGAVVLNRIPVQYR